MTGCNLDPAARESSMRCSSSARRLWLVLLPTKQTKLHDEKRLMTDKGTVVSLFLFFACLSRRPGPAVPAVPTARSVHAALSCARLSLRFSFRPWVRSFPAGSSLSALRSTIASTVVFAFVFACPPPKSALGPDSPPKASRSSSEGLAGVSRACEAAAVLPRAPKSMLRGGGSRAVFDGVSPSARRFTTSPRASTCLNVLKAPQPVTQRHKAFRSSSFEVAECYCL